MQHPLPIRGLPLAPTVPGLTVMEDLPHATSSQPRRPLTPIPFIHPGSIPRGLALVATAAESGAATGARARAARHPSHHRENPRPRAAAIPAGDLPAPQPSPALFPARHQRQDAVPFTPIEPDAFAPLHHGLAVRTPLDLVRLFPLALGGAALLAAGSGLLAGHIANRALGGGLPTVWFLAGYLALFLLNLVNHYFAAKGQLYFINHNRILRLLAANALLFLPHFILQALLLGMDA